MAVIKKTSGNFCALSVGMDFGAVTKSVVICYTAIVTKYRKAEDFCSMRKHWMAQDLKLHNDILKMDSPLPFSSNKRYIQAGESRKMGLKISYI